MRRRSDRSEESRSTFHVTQFQSEIPRGVYAERTAGILRGVHPERGNAEILRFAQDDSERAQNDMRRVRNDIVPVGRSRG